MELGYFIVVLAAVADEDGNHRDSPKEKKIRIRILRAD
jgi:hypothetical protein